MASGINFDLMLALAIVVVALGFFAWQFIATTRRAGLILSENRVPRRYLLLGFVAGLGLLYVTRR